MMKKGLQITGNKKAARLPVVMMAVIISFSPGSSSESLLRDVADGDALAAAAVAELNAYYAESPGFMHARAITIDTSYLRKATERRDLEVREHAPVLPAPRLAKSESALVMEWNGSLPESAGKVALTKINGKFHGSYQENGHHHVITPYRSGGKWMIMALVYEGEPPQCGMGMRAKYDDEEAKQ